MSGRPKKADRSHGPNGEGRENESMSSEGFNVHELLDTFWQRQLEKIKLIPADRFRDPHAQELPIARIKKIMKLDEEVKAQMISAEAPILLAKAAEIFIEELTLRAWVHTEDGKRKTLQKSDIAKAVSKYDQFDFLIDIIPREEVKMGSMTDNSSNASITATAATSVTMGTEQLQYFLQLGGLTSSVATPSTTSLSSTPAPAQSTIPQTVQLQNGQLLHATQIGQPIQLISGTGDIQQFITADGSVQHAPIQLSTAQLQFLLKAQFGSQQRQGGRQDGTGGSNATQTALFIQSGDDQQLTPLQVTTLPQQVSTEPEQVYATLFRSILCRPFPRLAEQLCHRLISPCLGTISRALAVEGSHSVTLFVHQFPPEQLHGQLIVVFGCK